MVCGAEVCSTVVVGAPVVTVVRDPVAAVVCSMAALVHGGHCSGLYVVGHSMGSTVGQIGQVSEVGHVTGSVVGQVGHSADCIVGQPGQAGQVAAGLVGHVWQAGHWVVVSQTGHLAWVAWVAWVVGQVMGDSVGLVSSSTGSTVAVAFHFFLALSLTLLLTSCISLLAIIFLFITLIVIW